MFEGVPEIAIVETTMLRVYREALQYAKDNFGKTTCVHCNNRFDTYLSAIIYGEGNCPKCFMVAV